MPTNYIPPRDGDFDSWVTNFSAVLTANPAAYGFTSADASTIAASVASWHAAYLAANNGGTRGPASVQAKNTDRASTTQIIRPYAVAISQNQGISNTLKTTIGVTVRKVTPTPIGAPTTSPLLAIIAATPLQFTMRASDQNSPDLRAKPFGVKSLELRVEPSAVAITDPSLISYYGLFSKQPMAVNFSSGDAGKTAYIAARWVSTTGLVGPWSTIHQFTVANGA